MARQLRVEYPGAIYHVTCRMLGDFRSRLFRDNADFGRFLLRLSERVEQYNIRLYMYTLMLNHVHLVFETPEGNISRFMHSMTTAYTVYYNLRHKRHGHLFDGRFKAKLVDGDNYLFALSRYVHLNPVKVASVKNRSFEEKVRCLRNYKWSSYPGYIDKGKRKDFVEYAPLSSIMGGSSRDWSGRYRKYIEEGINGLDLEFSKVFNSSPRCIGNSEFASRVDELYEELVENCNNADDVTFRHEIPTLDSSCVLNILATELGVEVDEFFVRRRDSSLRAVASAMLLKYAGKTQREIAEILNIGSPSTIGKQIMSFRQLLLTEGTFRDVTKRCEDKLERERSISGS